MAGSRTALVAGVGPTIGEATARRFAEEGWRVGLLARSEDRVERLAADLSDGPGDALAVPADVTDPDAVDRAVSRTREAFGPVEVLVANASAPGARPLGSADLERFETVWRVRAFGTFLLLRALAEDLEAVVVSGTTFASQQADQQLAWASAAPATRDLCRGAAPELDARVVYAEIGTAVAPADAGREDALDANRVAGRYLDLATTDERGFETVRIG